MKKELEELPIPLLQWYRENARTLPWRSDPTPYHVLVSEVMLQQTRVAAVLGYYARFMDALPTVTALAGAEGDALMKLWQGLGYYNRARNLQKAAQVIERDLNGLFPGTYEALLALPGVGDYTAGAVASIAFAQAVPAVDGNVLRVVARLTGDSSDVTKPQVKAQMRAALAEVLPHALPGDFNQALMELGATVCLPNGVPLCQRCPAADFCVARLEGRTGELPVKTPKKERRVEERAIYLIFKNGCVALRRRGEKGLLAGLWEYPNYLGGEEPPLTLKCLKREREGIHVFSHIEWHMTAYSAQVEGALPEGWVWVDKESLATRYAVPNAFQAFSHIVEERL